jgi:hypothetical protein
MRTQYTSKQAYFRNEEKAILVHLKSDVGSTE